MAGLKWTDADEIAFQLCEKYPDFDPMLARFTDLRNWVIQLDEFTDDPGGSSESALEAIQMAWREYYNENR